MTILETTARDAAAEFLASKGFDKNGTKLDAPKDEYYPGDEFRHRDHFGKQLDTLALDDDEREALADAIDADDDVAQIAEREAVRRRSYAARPCAPSTGEKECGPRSYQNARLPRQVRERC
jgi:hypothetical protein